MKNHTQFKYPTISVCTLFLQYSIFSLFYIFYLIFVFHCALDKFLQMLIVLSNHMRIYLLHLYYILRNRLIRLLFFFFFVIVFFLILLLLLIFDLFELLTANTNHNSFPTECYQKNAKAYNKKLENFQ